MRKGQFTVLSQVAVFHSAKKSRSATLAIAMSGRKVHPVGSGNRAEARTPGGQELNLEPYLLLVVPDELLESRVRAQGSKIRAGVDGGKIAVTKVESLLQLGQSFHFVTFGGIGGA